MNTKILLLATILLFSSFISFSQLSLDGTIKNEKDEPLSGATVLLENKSAKIRKATQTSENGSFHFTDVSAGTGYSLSFSYVGYASQVKEKIDLSANKPVSLDIKLEPTA